MWLALTVVGLLVGTAAAHAGFDSPLHHRSALQAAEPSRCPKATNPLECTSGSLGGLTVPHAPARSQYSNQSCRWLHVMYAYHHAPGNKPASLRALHGCSLWRADASYHIHTGRAHLSDPQQELLEQLSTLVIDLEGALS